MCLSQRDEGRAKVAQVGVGTHHKAATIHTESGRRSREGIEAGHGNAAWELRTQFWRND